MLAGGIENWQVLLTDNCVSDIMEQSKARCGKRKRWGYGMGTGPTDKTAFEQSLEEVECGKEFQAEEQWL